MKSPDKRQLVRLPLGQVPRGTMSLQYSDQKIMIFDLKDMSNSGISLTTNELVPVQRGISVRYSDAKVTLEVHGRVVWCKEVKSLVLPEPLLGKYLMGIELLSPMMLYAVLPKC